MNFINNDALTTQLVKCLQMQNREDDANWYLSGSR